MGAPGTSLKRIEDAMARATSPLARALKAMGEANRGRGTCLVLDHEDCGEVLIADRFWTHGRDETLRDRAHFALVDLEQAHGFRRIAVLVEPTGSEGRIDAAALALALAALDVTSALAAIAAPPDEAAAKPLPGARDRAAPVPRAPAQRVAPQQATTNRDKGVWGI